MPHFTYEFHVRTERERVQQHLTRAVQAGTQATLTLEEWKQTVADFNGLCAYCQSNSFDVLEHYYSVKVAGTHVQNCVPACKSCNSVKRNKEDREELVRVLGANAIERVEQYLASRVPSQKSAFVKRTQKAKMVVVPSSPEPEDKKHIAESVADKLRERIKKGEFGTGGRLPPISQIAKDYETTRPTVYQALALLQGEGMVSSKNRSYYTHNTVYVPQ